MPGLREPMAPSLRPLIVGRKRVKYTGLSLAWVAAAVSFWAWWLSPESRIDAPRYWAVTAAMAWLTVLQGFFVLVFIRARVPGAEPPPAAPAPGGLRVAMIVTKAPSEPFAVVQRTLLAMLAQGYPHDTWLADEDPSPETIRWCAAHGVRLSTRRGQPGYHRSSWPRRARCKEGNLAFFYDTYGYRLYDVVAQLDADHVPQPGYLREIMRGFADPGVGYVSAPSICDSNARRSWAARARLHTEAGFHGVFQAGYAAVATPMCIGSHYAVRTAALRQIGGLGPELAEDHSTTMLMAAGGWRGVHAMNAIAHGDGPEILADLCTQEFQWSRSLVSLLVGHTPRHLRALRPRLRLLFLFCQALYPMLCLFMAAMYLLPIVAILLDVRFANVTFPAFLLHSLPPAAAITAIAVALRADGWFRPVDARIFSWEKALFLAIQWPWALWGSIMAVHDRVSGRQPEFRITPKGGAAGGAVPWRVVLPYATLAVGSILPVLAVGELDRAGGFHVLALLNGGAYCAIVAVAVGGPLRDAFCDLRRRRSERPFADRAKLALAAGLAGLLGLTVSLRADDGLRALAYGLEPVALVRAEAIVSGAGMGGADRVRLIFDPHWTGRTGIFQGD